MKGSTAGALIPEIVRRGFQDLLEAEISALIGAHRLERCSDQGFTHRNVNRLRLLTTQMGDLTLPILRLRQGSFSPNWLEPRRRGNAQVEALGGTSGISKSEVSHWSPPHLPGPR